jgi:hypothetical protein
MIRVHVICEGQTEETFVKELLEPHFQANNIQLQPALLGIAGHKGGNVKFERLFIDIRNRLKGDQKAHCTTFFDFYALPTKFPGKVEASKLLSIEAKADCVCVELTKKLEEEFGSEVIRRFIPYVQMYEYEGLLFSDPDKFAKGIFQEQLAPEFQKIRDQFSSPEEINDSPLTAPSKRILSLVESYEKPIYGVLAAVEIGLVTMRKECKLFDAWLSRIENLAAS